MPDLAIGVPRVRARACTQRTPIPSDAAWRLPMTVHTQRFSRQMSAPSCVCNSPRLIFQKDFSMNEPGIVMYLVIATFAIAIACGVYQLYRVNKAKREHHRSARTPAEVAKNEQH